MSTTNTIAAVIAKVISDAREEEINTILRTLHGKVRIVCPEVGISANFPDTYEACGLDDIKRVEATARLLIGAKRKDRKDRAVASIREKIVAVVNTYMVKARKQKERLDALRAETPEDERGMLPSFSNVVRIPLTDIRACFDKGADDKQVFSDLEYMGYKVTDLSPNGKVLVPFKSEDDKGVVVEPDTSAQDAPKSNTQAKAA